MFKLKRNEKGWVPIGKQPLKRKIKGLYMEVMEWL